MGIQVLQSESEAKFLTNQEKRKQFSTVAEAIEEAKKYLPGIEVVLNETN